MLCMILDVAEKQAKQFWMNHCVIVWKKRMTWRKKYAAFEIGQNDVVGGGEVNDHDTSNKIK